MEKFDDIQLQRINFLRGPNVWTYRSVLEVWLDLGLLEDFPSNLIPGLTDRLLVALPALGEHHCGVGEKGGFLQRLQEGTWAGHILEHVVIELLNLADMPTGFGQTRSTSQRGVYRMVFRARDEQVARQALEEGHRLLMNAINNQPTDTSAAVQRLRDKVEACYLGPSTASIVAAAADRHIPHMRLNGGNLVQLGHGARQRRIWTAETDLTSAIAEGIAREKDLTKSLLKACGVPVPEGVVVESPEAAWEAALDIGLPVVVKPTDGNHGRGVSLDLNLEADVKAAFPVAEAEGSGVIVEQYILGQEHRLLVVGGKVVAAVKGDAASVVADGRSTVRALIDSQINSDPRRGDAEDFPLSIIRPEDEGAVMLELQRQGLTPESVPEAGRKIMVVRNGNLAIDCTDDVHPEVAHMASLAARMVGLDIAGIDLVAQDISKPLQDQGGAVVEVNAGPGLLMHLKPAVGQPRPVGRAIVDHLFAPTLADNGESPGRIPIVGVTGTQDTHVISRLVAWLMHLGGHHVGLACRDGLFLNRRRVERGSCAHFEAGRRLLINRSVDAAVFENSAESILRDGLAYDRCMVGVVTDFQLPEADRATLAHFDVLDSDQLFKVLRTQVDVVLPEGTAVLNGGEESVADLARLCDGGVILYGASENLPALTRQRQEGGRVVFQRGPHVVLVTGGEELLLIDLAERATRQNNLDTEPLPLEALLAAVATAWALGMAPDLINAGIDSFRANASDPLVNLSNLGFVTTNTKSITSGASGSARLSS
ncbi:MAG: cyanophycin synthetase [Burkholderiales bacterium]